MMILIQLQVSNVTGKKKELVNFFFVVAIITVGENRNVENFLKISTIIT